MIDAIRRLVVGVNGGLIAVEVEAEAEAFVAAICADDPDRGARWAGRFGRPKRFYERAVALGTPWLSGRPGSCPRLQRNADPAVAKAYAEALVDLATATGDLVEPGPERANHAAYAASAQLRAVTDPALGSPFRSPRGGEDPAVFSVPGVAPAAPGARADALAPSPTLDDLRAQLDALVGLTAAKQRVHQQVELLRIRQLRVAKGLKAADVARHLVFVRNPGTGKTTVARIVASIYLALRILERGQLVETDRSGLVAGYVGQTATKTADVLASALGGVLFIDEAYALARDEQFGNARFVRHLFEAAVVRQVWRLRDVASPTVEQLRDLQAGDLAPLQAPVTRR